MRSEAPSERSASVIGRRAFGNAFQSSALNTLKKHNFVESRPSEVAKSEVYSDGASTNNIGVGLKTGRHGLRRSGSEQSDNTGSIWSDMKNALGQFEEAR